MLTIAGGIVLAVFILYLLGLALAIVEAHADGRLERAMIKQREQYEAQEAIRREWLELTAKPLRPA